jgi:hypothetical protein
MQYFWISLLVMVAVLGLMAVGVLLGRRPIEGSCGGLGRLMGQDCEFCDKEEECKHRKGQKTASKKLPTYSDGSEQ